MKGSLGLLVVLAIALAIALVFGWQMASGPSDSSVGETTESTRASTATQPTNGEKNESAPGIEGDAGDGLPSNEKLGKFLNGETESSKD